MKIKLLLSVFSLSVFLSACDLTLEEIEDSIRQNPEILDRIDEFTESLRQEIESALDSGINDPVIIIEEPSISSESSSDTIITSSEINNEVVQEDSVDDSLDEKVATEEQNLETTSGVVEDETEIEEIDSPPTSGGGGGSSSSQPVTSSVSQNPINDLFLGFTSSLSPRSNWRFFPGETMRGVVNLLNSNITFTSIKLVIESNGNPPLYLESATGVSGTNISVEGVIPSTFKAGYYQLKTVEWETANDSGSFSVNWSGGNGSIAERPTTESLSLEPYTVLPRPSWVDPELVEEPIFVYAYEIDSGIYQVAAGNVITLETVMEDNGRKWGLVMVSHGHPKNGIWIETSYSGAYRGQYAGIGHYYSLIEDKFVSSLNQLDPNYVPPTYNYDASSGLTDSGITSSGVISSGLVVEGQPLIILNCNDLCWNDRDIAIQVGQEFVDPGATAIDQFGNQLPVTVTGEVNTMEPGRVYYIRYNAVDASGVAALEVIRNVNVQGHVITNPLNASLVGNAPVLRRGQPYYESGVSVSGTDGNSGGYTTTIESTVDTSEIGLYHVYYTITNAEGIQSKLVRTVTVIPWQYPNIVNFTTDKINYQTGETIVATLTIEGPQEARDAMTYIRTSLGNTHNNHAIVFETDTMVYSGNQLIFTYKIPHGVQGTYVSTKAVNGVNFSLTSTCGFREQPSADNPNPICEEGNISGANVSIPKITINVIAIDVPSETIVIQSGFTFNIETGTIINYDVSYGLDVIIPHEIAGVLVRRIDYRIDPEFSIPGNGPRGAFYNLGIRSVVLPDTLQYIGPGAFRSNNFQGLVYIPDSVTFIADFAFASSNITQLRLPEGSANPIGPGAFGYNNIKDLVIPDSIQRIPREAFGGNFLTSLSLGSGVREIGTGAFGNHSLTELIIPAQVEQILGSFRYSNPANTLQSIIIEGDSERFNDIWDAIFPAYLNPNS